MGHSNADLLTEENDNHDLRSEPRRETHTRNLQMIRNQHKSILNTTVASNHKYLNDACFLECSSLAELSFIFYSIKACSALHSPWSVCVCVIN